MPSPKLRLLGIETSSPFFSVAVGEGEQILGLLKAGAVQRPALLLTDLIEEALSGAGLELERLDGLAVSIGPGSFTGLRVGVMTAKTIAWALKKPILPVSSMEVIAWNLATFSGPVGLFLDARKGKVYSALFLSKPPGPVKRLQEDELLLPWPALERFPPGTMVVGDGLQRHPTLLARMEEKRLLQVPPESGIPSADSLCRIAAGRWPEGGLDDPHRLVPKYLYSKESDIAGW